MQDFFLNREELDEAFNVINKYRTVNMCGMGPVFDSFIQKAIKSDKVWPRFKEVAENFLNEYYFNSKTSSNLPFSTRDILNAKIWEEKCELNNIYLSGDNDVLAGSVKSSVHCEIDKKFISTSVKNDPSFVIKEFEDNKVEIVYYYSMGEACVSIEQMFLFIRAFWYYIEAQVIYQVIEDHLSEDSKNLLKNYIDLRKTLISPFLELNFPKTVYKLKIDDLNADLITKYYNKYFFSKLRLIQKRSILIAQVIRNEIKQLFQ
ncbi:MAG: hypothetical protein ACTSYF_08135 [Promethearchaeota archaeon]